MKPPSDKLPKKPMTRLGHRLLLAEYEELVGKTRPKIVEAIATAAAEGDRSENAEYIYGKKRLRELDKRIRYLDSLLSNVRIVPLPLALDRVAFGLEVTVRNEEDGKQLTWKIVGEGENQFHTGGISINTPVAKALFGKKIGDLVEVERPRGPAVFEVLDIKGPSEF